jgi:hypothetical protein
VILTELLIGQPLLPLGIEGVEDLSSVIRERCGALRSETPPELVELLVEMTEIVPEQRRASARELVHEFRHLIEGLGQRIRLGPYMLHEVEPRRPLREEDEVVTAVTRVDREWGEASTGDAIGDPSELQTVVASYPAGGDE